MTHPPLHPFQHEAAAAVLDAWIAGYRRVIAVIATGGGKTRTGAYAALWFQPAGPILWLTHRTELANQASGELSLWFARVGRIQAETTDLDAPVIVGMIQSLAQPDRLDRVRYRLRPALIIIDECHHVASEQYDTVLAAFPDTCVLGLTATPARGDGRSLHATSRRTGQPYFESIVYVKGVLDLMVEINPVTGQPFLCDIGKPLTIQTDVRVADLPRQPGQDFRESDLAQAVAKSTNRYTEAVRVYREHLAPRKTLVFAVDRHDAWQFYEAFTAAGIRADVVLGTTPAAHRVALLGVELRLLSPAAR